MGEASGKRTIGRGCALRSRRGLGLAVRRAGTRPNNTVVRDLLSDGRYTEAFLAFLRTTRVGEVKEGVICKQSRQDESHHWVS